MKNKKHVLLVLSIFIMVVFVLTLFGKRGDPHRLGPPDYDSYWIPILYDVEPTILGHSLGGNTDNYMVDLQFRGSNIWNEVSGPNIYGYGNYGCYWHNLTDQEVQVTRSHSTNRSTDEVRIRIWVYED